MIEFKDVSKNYGNVKALQNVSFLINKGEFIPVGFTVTWTKTNKLSFAGISTLLSDLPEMPSTFIRNWVYEEKDISLIKQKSPQDRESFSGEVSGRVCKNSITFLRRAVIILPRSLQKKWDLSGFWL